MARRRVDGTPTPEKKTCFVICPIGDEESIERKWSDDLLDCIITPIVEKMGYQTPIRADRINESGIITRQIVDLLIESDLVIADLSYRNPNVCYELAVRHVVKKPFIHMIRSGHKIPFDTASNRAITVDLDIRMAKKAMKDLENHIIAIENGTCEMDNPIENALTLRDLRGSGDPNQTISANFMETLQNMAADIKTLQTPKINPYAYSNSSGNIIETGSSSVIGFSLTANQRYLFDRLKDASKALRNLKAHNKSQEEIEKQETEMKRILNELSKSGILPQLLFRLCVADNIFEKGFDYNSNFQNFISES